MSSAARHERGRRARRNRSLLGVDAQLTGAAHLAIRGRLVVGRQLRFASSPVQSHVVVARGATLSIGDDVEIGHGAGISCDGAITIADRVVLGPFVQLLDSDHHIAGDTSGRPPEPQPITIGAGARIGAWSTILPGAVIGAGAVVGAGSVVSGTVADGERVEGNPAITVGGAHDRRVGASMAESVCALVTDLFALPTPATAFTTRDEIERWTSLGALRLLVGLEELVGRSLSDAAVSSAASVGDLIALAEVAA